MRPAFERRDSDAAGRIGTLDVPSAGVSVQTPALLPVVNPHLRTVDPARLTEFGAQIVITNAYILYGSDRRADVEADGVHDLLGFDGAVMTDSGSFQLAEYGELSVTTEEIVAFQREIGADIVTPVDIPTPPDASRDRAEADLTATQERIELAASMDLGDALLTAPIQGATYPDLRERAAADAYGIGDVYPVGGMVPLLRNYRFADVVNAVMAAKRGLGQDAPVHLFGAGHPMMFAIAVAAGCDLFDSAAYALYARDGRYLTVDGTEHLDDLDYFPCSCPICAERNPDALRDTPAAERERLLAEHNLHTSFAEIRRVRQAIRAGELLELVEARARAHPALLDGYRALLDHAAQLERTDPVRKGTFRYLSGESARRPEVSRHHERLDRLSVPERLLLRAGPPPEEGAVHDETWTVRPPFGPVPPALAWTYPLTVEVPERLDEAGCVRAADGIARLAGLNPDAEITFAHGDWPVRALDRIPDSVTVIEAD